MMDNKSDRFQERVNQARRHSQRHHQSLKQPPPQQQPVSSKSPAGWERESFEREPSRLAMASVEQAASAAFADATTTDVAAAAAVKTMTKEFGESDKSQKDRARQHRRAGSAGDAAVRPGAMRVSHGQLDESGADTDMPSLVLLLVQEPHTFPTAVTTATVCTPRLPSVLLSLHQRSSMRMNPNARLRMRTRK